MLCRAVLKICLNILLDLSGEFQFVGFVNNLWVYSCLCLAKWSSSRGGMGIFDQDNHFSSFPPEQCLKISAVHFSA